FSNGLGLAYYAFCPPSEQQMLRAMVGDSERQLLSNREAGWLDWRVSQAKEHGYAMRDPITEPQNSGTIAVPIMVNNRVAATIGITYFRRGVTDAQLERYGHALRRTANAIAGQIASIDELSEPL